LTATASKDAWSQSLGRVATSHTGHVHKLPKPGGNLLLMETMQDVTDINIYKETANEVVGNVGCAET
jgi:hypothetical protein